MTARDLFFGKRKYFYQIPGNRFVYKISVIRDVRQPVNWRYKIIMLSGFIETEIPIITTVKIKKSRKGVV